MKSVIFLLCFVSSLAFAQADKAEEELQIKIVEIEKARAAKKITELQYAKAKHDTIKAAYPDAYEVHTLTAYRVFLATQLKEKKISQAEYEYKWEERYNEFGATLQARVKQSEEEKMRQEQENANRVSLERQRKAQQDRAAAEYRERQQAMADQAEYNRQTQVTGNILQGVSNTFRNIGQPRGVNCISNVYGNTTSTNCR